MKCYNGGVPSEDNTYCICPNVHVSGINCDKIACENGGKDSNKTDTTGLRYCICPDETIRTRYCEKATSNDEQSTMVMLAVPIGAFVLLVIICIVAHYGSRARRRRRSRRRRTRNDQSTRSQRSAENGDTATREERNELVRYSDLPPQYSPPPTYERAIRAYISISLGNVLVADPPRGRLNRIGTGGGTGRQTSEEKSSRPQRLYYSKSHRTGRLSMYLEPKRQRSRSI